MADLRRPAAALTVALLLAGCSGGSPAIKESAPAGAPSGLSQGQGTVAATAQPEDPGVTAGPIPTPTPEVLQPGPAPEGTTQPFQGAGFVVAVPIGAKPAPPETPTPGAVTPKETDWVQQHDTDIDVFSQDSTEQQLAVVVRGEKTLEEAVTAFNQEDEATAIPVEGIAWEGATRAAYGETTYTEGEMAGVHVAVLFAQLPSGKIISVSAGAPDETFEDSLVVKCLNSFTPTG